MVYRSNDRVVEAARAEERELAALGRDARMRRARAAAVMGALGLVALAGPALAAKFPGTPRPVLHCHRVTIEYEPGPGMTTPPPISWVACEWK